jgi:hypothetical protein
VNNTNNLKLHAGAASGNCSAASTGYSYTLTPSFGATISIGPLKKTAITSNSLCTWVVTYPTGASNNDTLKFYLRKISSMSAYYMIGASYTSFNTTTGTAT